MKWETVACPKCGSKGLETRENGIFYCKTCNSYLYKNTVEEYNNAVQKAVDAVKQDFLFQRKLSLFRAVQEKHRSTDDIVSRCRSVQEIDADDLFAEFFMAVETGSKAINRFFDKHTETGLQKLNRSFEKHEQPIPPEFIHFILNYLLRSVKDDKCMAWVNYWIDTVIEKLEPKKVILFREAFKKQMEKINSDIYTIRIPRDIFLAYSSKDMKDVIKIVQFLEKEGYSVFAAFRNLWNGTGARENYQKDIEEAIRFCKCVVFVSSDHSRHKDCDAVELELPYIYESRPQMERIEYLLEPYGDDTSIAKTNFLQKEFFYNLRWVQSEEELTTRVEECLRRAKKRRESERNKEITDDTVETVSEDQPLSDPAPVEEPGSTPTSNSVATLKQVSGKPIDENHKHSYITSVIAPTCKERGYTAHVCKCGYHFEDTYTFPTEKHIFGEWYVHKQPTCLQAGEERQNCRGCDLFNKKLLPPKGHQYTAWEINGATCEKEGKRRRICNACGDIQQETIPATGHKYGKWQIISEPTCEQNGKRIKKCSLCDDTKEEIIPALGHKFTEWETEGEQRIRSCVKCGKIEKKDLLLYERQGNIVYFGQYPQSEKASNVTITQQNGKYIGNDGAEYVCYKSGLLNKKKYYKIEPVEWKILEEKDGYAVLLSQKILDARRFDEKGNNYANSEIRKWLNGEFFNRVFSQKQQTIIQTVTVDNSARSTNPDNEPTRWNNGKNDYACGNTTDKVWLLSEQEVTKSAYGFNTDLTNYDTVRRKSPSDYAKSQGAYTNTEADYKGKGVWWLRSPSCNSSDDAWDVYYYGRCYGYDYVGNTYGGVVPALVIRLS